MVYHSETDNRPSGGPILKAVKKGADGDMVIVGLHRGGHLDNWDDEGTKGCNFGSLFTDITESIKKDWHPPGNATSYSMYIHMYICTYVCMCIRPVLHCFWHNRH